MFLWGDMLGFYSSISLPYSSLTAGKNWSFAEMMQNGAQSWLFFFFFLPNVFKDFCSPHLKWNSMQTPEGQSHISAFYISWLNVVRFTHMDTQQHQHSTSLLLPYAYKQTGSH